MEYLDDAATPKVSLASEKEANNKLIMCYFLIKYYFYSSIKLVVLILLFIYI